MSATPRVTSESRCSIAAVSRPSAGEHVAEHEPVPLDALSDLDVDGRAEARRVVHERVELTPLTAGVDAGRKVCEQLGVEGAAGELRRHDLRVDAGQDGADPGREHLPG